MVKVRVEVDSLGNISLPDDVYYGIQTQRAIDNFDVSGKAMDEFSIFIASIAGIKKAAALANKDIGRLSEKQCRAICKAADEVIAGKMGRQFPVDIFQGGGGTSTNMNVNEVIANRATELLTGQKGYDPIHPNTHVNMGQSTNDVIPAAMKMATYKELERVETSLGYALTILQEKEAAFVDVIKLGRTCLQDALPMTLGQMFSGYRASVERQIETIRKARELMLELPLPATAIGTCFGTFPGFEPALYKHLGDVTGVPFQRETNLWDGLQNADVWIQVSACLKSVASVFNKLSSDLRLMSSGPRAGFNEINLPAVQPGSSIMPGKINPVMPEMMMQVAFKVFGNDLSVSLAADRGELDLNVWESLILNCVSESITLLEKGIVLLTDRCLRGITANREKCAEDAGSSLALSTVLATLFDYPVASGIAKMACKENTTIKEIVIREGLLSQERAELLLNPANLIDINVFDHVVKGMGADNG
ncbi:aspartate ammonia-lyase [Desulfoluna spongiiphila]|uniref:Aspartate ammonia-lyase n=1 Tax=Desulfoluna spongiiphila TaxID=419481 RepID=A0A1G5CQ85_9BACT|nr:aspartate ammonia-lyase [Desulfoluna spongiiphila]SCY04487.1 aspartate ammonia-lyase [Desulfoluna spongiiphila]